MRITIGNPKTKKFSKMIDVYTISSSDNSDKIVYVSDHYGMTIALIFPNHESLVSALQDLKNFGSATAYCDFEYYHEDPAYDDYSRELDPYFDIDEIFERS